MNPFYYKRIFDMIAEIQMYIAGTSACEKEYVNDCYILLKDRLTWSPDEVWNISSYRLFHPHVKNLCNVACQMWEEYTSGRQD
jgi:hypothetical protein